MSSVSTTISQGAATAASVLGILSATFGQDSAASQQADVLEELASDISIDAGQPLTVQTLLQAALEGPDGRFQSQALQLFLMQITPGDAASAAINQYNLKWDQAKDGVGPIGALATPQLRFDALSAEVFAELHHDCRSKPGGFLTDEEFAFESVRRHVWVLAHQATYALMLLQDPTVKGQIQNDDLSSEG